MPSWLNNKIKRPINVIYLCGEGLVGVKRRLRAWKADRGVEGLGNFAVYPLPLDLDKPEGIHEIRTQIETLGWKPDVIVIDTRDRYKSAYIKHQDGSRTDILGNLVWSDADLSLPIAPGANVITVSSQMGDETNLEVDITMTALSA